MQNHAGSRPKECLQKLADRGYDFNIIRNNGVHPTTISYLTNNEEHLDIFLRKPLMPTEKLDFTLMEGATHQKAAKSNDQKADL